MDLNPHDYLSWLSFRGARLLVACRPAAGLLEGCLLSFEPQLLKRIVHINVGPFRANLISLKLIEGSSRLCDGVASSRCAVCQRAGVGAAKHPLGGDQAASGVSYNIDKLQRTVGIGCPHPFEKVAHSFSGYILAYTGMAIGCPFGVSGENSVDIVFVPVIYDAF